MGLLCCTFNTLRPECPPGKICFHFISYFEFKVEIQRSLATTCFTHWKRIWWISTIINYCEQFLFFSVSYYSGLVCVCVYRLVRSDPYIGIWCVSVCRKCEPLDCSCGYPQKSDSTTTAINRIALEMGRLRKRRRRSWFVSLASLTQSAYRWGRWRHALRINRQNS